MRRAVLGKKFDSSTTIELATAFTAKEGGSISHLKLLKLMYVFERYWLLKRSHFLTRNRVCMMDHGPVLSETLDLINQNPYCDAGALSLWRKRFNPISNNTLSFVDSHDRHRFFVKKNLKGFEVDSVSPLDNEAFDLVNRVYGIYGKMSKFELRDYTHTFAEWSDPRGTSRTISHNDLYEYIISDCRKGTDSLFAKLCSEDYVQPNFDFNRLEALSESKDTLTLKKGMSREERRAAIMDFANI